MDKIWRAKHIPLALKVNIFQASVVSVLLYGCESWIVDENMEKKINCFGSSCYRIMLGIRRLDKITNESVYEQVRRRPLAYAAYKRQLQWLGHALRREENEPSRIFALYEPAQSLGRSKPGQPPRTFTQHIAHLLTSAPSGLSSADIARLAKDRKEWSKRVAEYG